MMRGWSVPAAGAANERASIAFRFAGRLFGAPDGGPRDCVGGLRGLFWAFCRRSGLAGAWAGAVRRKD